MEGQLKLRNLFELVFMGIRDKPNFIGKIIKFSLFNIEYQADFLTKLNQIKLLRSP